MQAFEIKTCPLSGRHLIEASAGTGKTYTLVNLYLRLLFERQFLPRQILVVTFTEAATQELTQRLRDKIRAFRSWFLNPETETQADNLALFQQIQTRVNAEYGAQALPRQLERVQQDFDNAPISTIHSFCQAALQSHALHSAQSFQARLDNETGAQVLQAVADVWRQCFYGESAQIDLLQLLLAQKISPDSLAKDFATVFETPDLRCIPEPDSVDFAALETELKSALGELKQSWQAHKTEISRLIFEAIDQKWLSGVKYKKDAITKASESLDAILGSEQEPGTCLQALLSLTKDSDVLAYFTSAKLSTSTNKNKPNIADDHAFFAQAQAVYLDLQTLLEAQQNAVFSFYQTLFREVRQRLRAAKAQAQILGFQDLLLQLAEALAPGPGGDSLAALLQKERPVALIDEFQDTDRWQYAIFDRIYAAGDLFLIGDPKQSIYRFRGADLQVYLSAREGVVPEQRWTLASNYRSSAAYITALNRFFTHPSLHPQPFGIPEIQYHPVKAGRDDAAVDDQPALCIWYAEPPESKKQHEKYDFERLLLEVVAEGVYQELERGTPAEAIAILVSKHRQADNLARVLQQRQIPCLVHGQQNVFRSQEAQDMVLFLQAVLSPREALTPVFTAFCLGYTAAEIQALQANESAWVTYLESCQELRQLWQRYGFFTIWSRFVDRFEVYTRSLLFQHGERAITNFRQLASLLQEAALANALSPEHTLLWLQRQMNAPSSQQDEQLLHLESERKAVQILTMHRSKGLEFPVVFCPYLWVDNATRLTLPFEVVLESGETVLELGSAKAEQHKKRAKAQLLQDQLRLSYVALTRAAQRCHVYWGAVARQSQSPLKHYFQATDTALDTLNALAAEPHIQVLPFPTTSRKIWRDSVEAQAQAVWNPDLSPKLTDSFLLTSFTRLSAQAEDGSPIQLEQALTPEPSQLELQPLLAFPRGAESGIFLHSVFEQLDFASPLESQHAILLQQLALYGLDLQWAKPLQTALTAILETPFTTETSLSLRDLDPQLCLKEWDFDLSFAAFDRMALQDLYRANGLELLPDGKSASSAQSAYLKGSIDLLFCHEGQYFIADYKSNDLGPDLSNYQFEALAKAMQEHQYFLQLTLYTLALHLYLQQHLPDYTYEKAIGGAYYFFLRGMHPETPGNGVYFYRPEQSLIENLARHWSTA